MRSMAFTEGYIVVRLNCGDSLTEGVGLAITTQNPIMEWPMHSGVRLTMQPSPVKVRV